MGGDGLLNVWNLWWFQEAVFRLHQSPFFTTYIHHPYGISLFGHDLAPLNGFLSSLLAPWAGLLRAHNAIVLFGFLGSGLLAFRLCYHFTRSWGPSLLGGYLFTFSQYHFAHAEGHLSLTSTQWLPLFALAWSAFLRTARSSAAAGAALALALALFCNYYYFLYCLYLLALFTAWQAVRRRDPLFLVRPPFLRPALVFVGVAALLAAPLVLVVLHASLTDPLLGTQDRSLYSLDLLAPVIPGGHWRFAELTRGYWSALPGNIHESSVSVGVAVIVLLVLAWRHRPAFADPDTAFWFVPLVLFGVLSLGPVLHVWGREVPFPMPLVWLEKVLPPLRLQNAPVRMAVMCVLSASVLVAAALDHLWRRGGRGRALAALLVGVAAIETLPRPLPLLRVEVPAYMEALRSAEGPGAVLDTFTPENLALFLQTVHHRPLVFGRVSRVPTSVAHKDAEVRALVNGGEYSRLFSQYGVRFVVVAMDQVVPGARLVCLDREAGAALYDLATSRPATAG